jgi:hypothetical protein
VVAGSLWRNAGSGAREEWRNAGNVSGIYQRRKVRGSARIGTTDQSTTRAARRKCERKDKWNKLFHHVIARKDALRVNKVTSADCCRTAALKWYERFRNDVCISV